MSENKSTYTGEVIFFNSKLGYGFIKRDDNKKDIFVYYTDIQMKGYKTLESDDKVSFEEGISSKNRLIAVNVNITEKSK